MTRTAGTPNKNKRGMAQRLRESYGKDFDVIMMLAKNCHTLHEIALVDCSAMEVANVKAADAVEDESEDAKELLSIFQDTREMATDSAIVAIAALDKLAQYVTPKLKAIEVKGDISVRPKLIDLSGGKLEDALLPALEEEIEEED